MTMWKTIINAIRSFFLGKPPLSTNLVLANAGSCTDTICLTVLNHDTGQPSIYIGQAAVLDVSILNNTGSDITLQSGSPAAELDIFFLSLGVNLNDCHISLPGWTMKAGSGSLALAYTASDSSVWAQGDVLSFQITGVQSSAQQAVTGFFQVNFTNMSSGGGNALGRRKMSLMLIAAPQNDNALDVSVYLEDGGVVYVTQPSGPAIENSLLLTITNKGKQALFTGSKEHLGNPKITVSFVYGSTPGALAPDIDKKQPDSAWWIKSTLAVSEGNDWTPTKPDTAAADPVWIITPGQNNTRLIGTGDAASVTFSFDHIISQTAPGATLMNVVLSGFKKDDNTLYNDQVFVLDISKKYLPDPGLIRFSSTVNEIPVKSAAEELTIPLRWSMAGVSKIVLQFYSDNIPNLTIDEQTINYPSPQPPLQYDHYLLQLSGVGQTGSLLITAKASDANGNDLNNLQYTVDFDFPPVVTSYKGEFQPDGSVLLQWTTQGATGVIIGSNTYNANGKTSIPKDPAQLLLNNPYYALRAEGPNKTSDPCVFKSGKKIFVPVGAIDYSGEYPTDIVASPDHQYAFIANEEYAISVIGVNGDPPFQVVSPAINAIAGGRMACSPNGDFIFVPDPPKDFFSISTSVSVVQTRTVPPFQVLASAIKVGQGPSAIAITPDGNYALVANAGETSISVIDIRSGPPFPVLSPAIGIGNNPAMIACSPKGDYAFILAGDSSVAVMDIRNGPPFQVLPEVISIGKQSRDIGISPKGDYIFVLNDMDNTVTVLDLRSGLPFQLISPVLSVSGTPSAIAFSPDGDYAFVVCNPDLQDGVMYVFDLRNGPPFPLAVPPFNGIGYASTGIAFSPNGNYAFVSAIDVSHHRTYILGPMSADAFKEQ